MSYNLITCIVEKGKSHKVVDKAIEAGAQAATVFHAYGRGVREKLGILGKLILPYKEVILIVTKESETDAVFEAITKAAELHVPGRGFAFVQTVDRAVGFLD